MSKGGCTRIRVSMHCICVHAQYREGIRKNESEDDIGYVHECDQGHWYRVREIQLGKNWIKDRTSKKTYGGTYGHILELQIC